MELELNKNKALNEIEISYKEKISNVDTNPLLNPEKGKIIGYKEKDINNLSKYSKDIKKDILELEKDLISTYILSEELNIAKSFIEDILSNK